MELQGINIQWPISQEILEGRKIIETRTYPIPNKFIGINLFFIETPGLKGNFKARIVGTIRFSGFKIYKDINEFRNDESKHLVEKGSEWDWKDKPKYGWIIDNIEVFNKKYLAPPKRGYVYTSKISLSQLSII